MLREGSRHARWRNVTPTWSRSRASCMGSEIVEERDRKTYSEVWRCAVYARAAGHTRGSRTTSHEP